MSRILAAVWAITEIWAWDFEDLECTHDYIQWLFPLDEQKRQERDLIGAKTFQYWTNAVNLNN